MQKIRRSWLRSGLLSIATIVLYLYLWSSGGLSQAAYLVHTQLWTQSSWSPSTLHVCFETVSFPTQMEIIREEIEATWPAESAINFIWDTGAPCSSQTTRNIRIDLTDTNGGCAPTSCANASTAGDGLAINDLANGVHICACTQNSGSKQFLIEGIVHEFGHALSVEHENNRPDQTYCLPHNGPQDWIEQTQYDAYSVMNYCNPVHNNAGFLSSSDNQGINLAYGAAHPLAAISQGQGSIDLIARRTNAPAAVVSVRNYSAGAWGSWVDLPTIDDTPPPSAPAAVSWDSTRLDVFVRSNDGHLMQALRVGTNGGTWYGWYDQGAPVTTNGAQISGEPVAVSRASNRLTIVAKNYDETLSILEWNGTQWLPWVTVAASKIYGKPTAVVAQDGSVQVFAHGPNHNLMTIRSAATGTWPTSWTDLGGIMLGSPGAVKSTVSSTNPDVFVFVRGVDNPATLWYRELTGSTWGPWTSLGATPNGITGTPTVVSHDFGYVDVFVRDSANQIWVRDKSPTVGWHAWGQLPGIVGTTDGSPTAISAGSLDMHVFTRSSFGGLAWEHYSCSGTCSWATAAGLPHVGTFDNLIY